LRAGVVFKKEKKMARATTWGGERGRQQVLFPRLVGGGVPHDWSTGGVGAIPERV